MSAYIEVPFAVVITWEQVNSCIDYVKLRKIAVQRENEAKGDPVLYVPIIPDTKEQLAPNAPTFIVEAVAKLIDFFGKNLKKDLAKAINAAKSEIPEQEHTYYTNFIR